MPSEFDPCSANVHAALLLACSPFPKHAAREFTFMATPLGSQSFAARYRFYSCAFPYPNGSS